MRVLGWLRAHGPKVCFALAVVVPASMAVAALIVWDRDRGIEPAIWSEAISAWPGLLIRLAAFFLCVGLIWQYAWSLREQRERLGAALGLDVPMPTDRSKSPSWWQRALTLLKRGWDRLQRSCQTVRAVGCWRACGRFWRAFCRFWRGLDPQYALRYSRRTLKWYWTGKRRPEATRSHNVDEGDNSAAIDWKWYRQRASLARRLRRTSIMWGGFIALVIVSVEFIDPPSETDLRTSWLRGFGALVWYSSGLTFHFLNFFVLDACILEKKFADRLSAYRAPSWPKAARELIGRRHRINGVVQRDECLVIGVIAARTREVSAGVIYSAVVLSLLLISVQPVFERWPSWTWSVAGTFGLSALLVLASATALRSAAELARRRVLARLGADVEEAEPGSSPSAPERPSSILEAKPGSLPHRGLRRWPEPFLGPFVRPALRLTYRRHRLGR